jgi:hypothetical protein
MQPFTEDIQKALDNLLVTGIFLDLTKAFDVINCLLSLSCMDLKGIIH